jgi:ribosomal protein L11 methyltransferase
MTEQWEIFHIFVPESPLMEETLGNCFSRFNHVGYYEVSRQGDVAEWHLYFEPDAAPADFANEFDHAAQDFGLKGASVQGPFPAPRENWHDAWRQYFRPVDITPRMVIVPSWEQHLADAYENAGKLVLRIEPGMAFGTGTHATTQLCLAIAEEVIKPDARVMDAGTGSAILAIAAAKLGAGHVTGFDLDPDIVENAAFNLELNHVDSSIVDVRISPLEHLRADGPYDVIFCNMLSHEFQPLLPALAQLLDPAVGKLILSGMLTDEAEEVRGWLNSPQINLKVLESRTSGEWTAFLASH